MIRAVGIGDYVIDRYYHYGLMFPGGNALNFAVYSKQLGCESAFVGVLADDKFADFTTEALDAREIDRSHCAHVHGETWLCNTRFENGDRIITDDNDGGVVKNQPLKVDDGLIEYVRDFDIIHTNVNGCMDNEIEKLKSTGVPIIYDYSDIWETKVDLLRMCPYINYAFFSGKSRPQSKLKKLMKAITDNGCELAICTIGAQGAIVFDGMKYFFKKPYNTNGEILDTLGAGDSFLTGFIVTYIKGLKYFWNLAVDNKQKYCTTENIRSYKESLIDYSMQIGNLLAIKNCTTLGAFDHGVTLVE